MSNVKSFNITGWVPFNITNIPEVRDILGHFTSPTIGIRIQYTEMKKAANENGGQTAFYKFQITGIEALSYKFIDRMLATLKEFGAEIADEDVKISALSV